MTPPEGGRDIGPGEGLMTAADARASLALPPADSADVYTPPVVSATRHRELEADRDRWRTAWDEERRARVIAEQAGSTGLADAARLRMALNVALDELRSEGRPAAKAIADASGTMANALEGRPLAAARNDEGGPSWTNGDGGPQAVVDMALTQLRVTPGARAFIVARRRHDLRWLYTLLCQSAPESYRAREGYRDLRTPEGGSIAVVDPTAFAERPEGIYVYRQVSS